jgi:hypothetical protein
LPLFPVTIWNCYDRTLGNLPRTNNNLESWHNAIQSETKKHMSILRVIQYLRTEQDFSSYKLVKISTGEFDDKQNANERLVNVLKDYDKDEIIDYLKCVALCLTSLKHSKINTHLTDKREFIKANQGDENIIAECDNEEAI